MQRFREIIRTALSPVWLLDDEINAATTDTLAASVKNNTHWLLVGCGLKQFASSFNHAHYIGIDIEVGGGSFEMKVPDNYFDGINIRYEDNTFDGELCSHAL